MEEEEEEEESVNNSWNSLLNDKINDDWCFLYWLSAAEVCGCYESSGSNLMRPTGSSS